MTTWEIHGSFIKGLMLGIESPPVDEMGGDDLLDALVIDLFIYRFVFLKWKVAD